MTEEVTVERVSQFGLMVNGAWVNFDKAANIDGKQLFHNGDVLSVTKNAKGFITSAELVSKGAPKVAWKGSSSATGAKSEFRTVEQIIRSVAVESVFSSPTLATLTKDMSKEEAVAYLFEITDHVATFVTTGA